MSIITTKNLDIGYVDKTIVKGLNIGIPRGKITALVGGNGSGKSTILKTIARILKPQNGGVYLNGESIHKQSTKSVAKKLAILPQNPSAPEGLTVAELVSYGRFPHQKRFGTLAEEDYQMIEWALNATGMAMFAERPLSTLSGGQRQKAWIAMALAQGTDTILLDEPTTFLDMAHQFEVLNLLKKLNSEEKQTIVMVVHDLNHATRFAHYMIAIKDGKVVKEGKTIDVTKPDILEEVFGICADIVYEPKTGIPLVMPYDIVGESSRSQLYTVKETAAM
ncbi:MAG: ABC transporter ATP-binding protein [Clostridia bacterium]|jgi:iron complex transport system ATP-binding protein|nr:ABC transporter ATP-binding protein [Clostridia bacterium]